jgi:hypothetical protein
MQLNKEKQAIIMVIVVVIAMALFAVLVKQGIDSNKVTKQTPRVDQINQNQKIDHQVKENSEDDTNVLVEEEDMTEKDLEKKIEFSDETLKLSFLYPSFLGEIKVEKKENSYFLMFGKDLFFVAINPNYEVPPRGGFFGDVGFDIDNKKYIEDYCKNKENCISFLNNSNILIVKHDFMDFDSSIDESSEGMENFTHYYLYNPNTEYAGIAISPIRIKNRYKDVDIDRIFNSIINSINFLN